MAREDEGKPAYWSAFLRNRWTWIGFAAAAIPQMIAGLHVYYPNLPDLAVKYVDLNRYFTDAPWNAVGQFQLSFYPCLIGFGYLLTTETAFSVWFFYLFTKFERILGRAFGLTGVGRGGLAQFPFEEHQGVGAWIALIVFGLWIGRRYYRDVLRAVWGRPAGEMSETDLKTYRFAVTGAAVGLVTMALFATFIGNAVRRRRAVLCPCTSPW